MTLFSLVFAPGFFSSTPVQTAAIIGAGAAIVSGVAGMFTVIRGQSFAGHALADISSAGGAGAFLLGINPLLGFLGMALFAAGGMEFVKIEQAKERDLMTGIVLCAGLGLTALFLYFDLTSRSTTGAAISVMFGSMFAIPASILPLVLATGAAAIVVIAFIYRPLMLCSFAPELASVQGINVRMIELLYLVVLSLAVCLTAVTVGAILSTALLIGPAATALRLVKQPAWAILWSVLIGIGATWGGIVLAYDSYGWTGGHGWPVSFFIVAIIFTLYVAVAGIQGLMRMRGSGGVTVPGGV